MDENKPTKNWRQRLGVASSADANKISLTVKAILVFVVTVIGMTGVVDVDAIMSAAGLSVDSIVAIIVNVVVAVGAAASALTALYGAWRKRKLGRWQAQ